MQDKQIDMEDHEETEFTEKLRSASMSKQSSNIFTIAAVVAVVLGISAGYVLANFTSSSTAQPTAQQTRIANTIAKSPTIQVGQVFGSKDTKSFPDSAEGILLPGGIGSEGSDHIVRAGGASQNVYLTSSIVDLSMFENAKVKVFGQTFKAQKAGWLMDVGRVEVEELNAPLPDWAKQQQQTDQNAQSD